MTTRFTPDTFRDRYAIATFPEGGMVVDLETGGYARLNATAAAIFEEIQRAEHLDEAIAQISQRLKISPTTATSHTDALMSALGGEAPRRELPDPFRYLPAPGGGYEVWHGTTRVLRVAEDGRTIALVCRPGEAPLRTYDYVSGIAPKLLSLRGRVVMHGSSCMRGESGESLLGICGWSRAGKTTTARMLAKHGSPLVSEDLLVFSDDLSVPSVFVGGEKRVDQWARSAAALLDQGADSVTDTEGLLDAASGPTVPLRAVWFLDATRRGDRFALEELPRPAALALVMANHFLGAAGTQSWRHHLQASHAIAGRVRAYEVYAPNGLDRLDEAIRVYTTSSAS